MTTGITYLTMDSVREGVGASQVLPYVRRLSDYGHDVELVSFEHDMPSGASHLPSGVEWFPREFGRGRIAPFRRIGIAAHAARSARDRIVHARSDLPALATMLAGHDRWVWDMRAFWREQRIYLGDLRPGSPSEVMLRHVERQAAERSSAIICLAQSAVELLSERFGPEVAEKATVIPTAVDTSVFVPSRPLEAVTPTILLSGTYNRFYDGDATARFIQALRRARSVRVGWIGARRESPWWATLRPHLDEVTPSVPFDDVPGLIASSDVGLAICQFDGGAALRGAMPTKIAEFLACGRPVVVNRGLGDMDEIIARFRCGIVIEDSSDAAIELAAERLFDLLEDDLLPERARACAKSLFDLENSTKLLSKTYSQLY